MLGSTHKKKKEKKKRRHMRVRVQKIKINKKKRETHVRAPLFLPQIPNNYHSRLTLLTSLNYHNTLDFSKLPFVLWHSISRIIFL